MLIGNVTMGAGAAGATGCGALSLFLATGAGASRFSSLELQLEIPKAANNERTKIVKATRAGVHNGLASLVFFDFFISCLLRNPELLNDYNRQPIFFAPTRGLRQCLEATISQKSGLLD
jgi:hypothetical protein